MPRFYENKYPEVCLLMGAGKRDVETDDHLCVIGRPIGHGPGPVY